MNKLKTKIRLGITMGDPASIGPAIIIKAIHRVKGLADFVIIGDKWAFNKIPNPKSQIVNCKFIDLNNVPRENFSFGKVKPEYGRASVEYLDKAIKLIKNNEIDCLVTCPVSKEAINLAGFKGFSGHTEYLASATKTKDFAMMLLNKRLKISLVTRHVSLKDVPGQLNKDKIHKTIILSYKSLKELFGIKNPRIVVCGLNPHASDNGVIGKEEKRIIEPALIRLKRKIKGISIDGPQPADTAILKAAQKKYDCVIAMYHDQALIPLKISGGYTGVNLTLGLGFVRTSPLHGTAFDIAGKYSLANPASLIEAIRLAIRCTLNQKKG